MTEQSTSEAQTEQTVVVSRSVGRPVKDVWGVLVTPKGAEALLGEGGTIGDKGHAWRAADGTFGVVRSYHPLEQIRFSWHAGEDAPKSLVDLHLISETDASTKLEIRHEHVPGGLDPQTLTKHWGAALDTLVAVSD